jgi:PAS domain S-box-containing protein
MNNRERALFNRLPEAMVWIEADVLRAVNERARLMLGEECTNWVGQPWKTIAAQHFPQLHSISEDHVSTAPIQNIVIEDLQGGRFHAEWKWKILETNVFLGQFRDISERVFFEQAIRESEQRFKSLSIHAMEGIALLNDQIVIDSNEQFARLLGFRRVDEILGVSIHDFIRDRDWRRISARSQYGSRCEIEATTGSGQLIHLEVMMTESSDEYTADQVLLIYDITERKRTELDLLQTKERFRLLVENNPIGLFLLVDGRVKYANAAALDLVQFPEEQLFDFPFDEFFIPGERQRVKANLNRTREGEKTPYTELKLLRSDGSSALVGMRMTLSFYDRSPAVQVTLMDLSTRTELLREQMRAAIAEESNTLLKAEIERHKETQGKLRAAELLNRSMIESSIDMIIAFDKNGQIIQWNHAASVEFGWTLEEAKMLEVRALFADDEDVESIFENLDRAHYFAGEVQGIRASGEEFNVLMSVASMRDDSGDIIGYVAVGRDITDLKLAEQELRESEERYRDILEYATDVIFLVNATGHFVYANPSFFRTLGYDPKSIEEIQLDQIMPEIQIHPGTNWMEALEGTRGEWVFRAANGTSLLMLGGASVRYDQAGDREGLRGIFLDITDIRRHERSARIQSAKLQSIFNSTRYLLMLTMDRTQQITTINRNFQEVFQQQFNVNVELGTEFTGLFQGLANTDFYQGQLKLVHNAFSGRPQQFEMALNAVDGTIRWFIVFINPVAADSEPEEVSCIAYDITDRKEIDQQIRSALKEKEILLQEVHHRVKNNLQVISSMLNLQRRFVADPLLLQVLDESTNRIATMSYIHESLYQNTDFSSISFSEYLKRLTSNLMSSYAQQTAQVELDTKLIDLHLNLEQAIPCGLIVNELVSNCMKYAFQGLDRGVLTLRVEWVGEFVEIEVADNGVGLPEDFNFDTNDSLGVYLIQALTEQIQAELIVRSSSLEGDHKIPRGSSFMIKFVPSS